MAATGGSTVAYCKRVCLVILCLCCAFNPATSQPEGLSSWRSYQHKQLKDIKKLQPNFWLQAASKHLSSASNSHSAGCLKDYGQPYLTRWQALHGTYCNATTASPEGSGSSTSSHVQCYAHPEADLSTCLVQNLLVTSTRGFIGSTPHSSELPQPLPGSLQLACNVTAPAKSFLRGRLQSNQGSRAWMVTAPQVGAASSRLQHACSGPQAVAHPVLFVLQVDPQNAFHNLEAVVSVFSALAVLQLQPQYLRYGIEVVIADDRQAGYFQHIWRRLSWPHPLRILRQHPFPDNTCFTRAIIAPYTAHAQSLLTYKAGSVDEVLCESVVLQGVSRWLRHLFRDLLPLAVAPTTGRTSGPPDSTAQHGGSAATGLGSSTGQPGLHAGGFRGGGGVLRDLAPLRPSPTQSSPPLQLLYVVWLSRRRFEQQRAPKLTDWQKARVLSDQQQEELVLGLQRAVLQWNAQTCITSEQKDCKKRSVMFALQVAELSEMSFYPDQLHLMMRAGVLVGVHGAGLANQVYMHPRAGAVVEVWYGMDSNTHYHNMAHMLGHAYFNVKCEDQQLDVGQVVTQVTAGMDEAASRHAAVTEAAKRSRHASAWWWQTIRASTDADA